MKANESQRPRINPTSILLPERERQLARTVASSKGLSMSAFVVQVVREYLARPEVRAEAARALELSEADQQAS